MGTRLNSSLLQTQPRQSSQGGKNLKRRIYRDKGKKYLKFFNTLYYNNIFKLQDLFILCWHLLTSAMRVSLSNYRRCCFFLLFFISHFYCRYWKIWLSSTSRCLDSCWSSAFRWIQNSWTEGESSRGCSCTLKLSWFLQYKGYFTRVDYRKSIKLKFAEFTFLW